VDLPASAAATPSPGASLSGSRPFSTTRCHPVWPERLCTSLTSRYASADMPLRCDGSATRIGRRGYCPLPGWRSYSRPWVDTAPVWWDTCFPPLLFPSRAASTLCE
jgi:hypothetical protein